MVGKTAWTDTTIGRLCDDNVLITQTGPFGSQLHKHDYVYRGVPVIPTEAIGRRRFHAIEVPRIAPETADRLSRHQIRPGDILFARRGVQATGLSALARQEHSGWICGTGAILLRVIGSSVDAEFLSFLISSEPSFKWLRQHAVGAVMPNLNESIIRRLPLRLPPLPTQRAIARILGTLDDKIELNRRMNETLEAMARAVFKSWFVDFDPVRAKMDGRQPAGMDAETAALFPDSFEESELGLVPKGWRVGKLEAVLSSLETGSRPKGGVSGITSGVPSVGAESIVRIGHFDFNKTKYVPIDFYTQMTKGHVESCDILLYKDGGRPGEYEPHVSMFGDGFPFERFCINEHVYRLRANECSSQPYLYFWLTSDSAMNEMRIKGTGVAIPGLNSTAVKSLITLIPSQGIVPVFDRTTEPSIARLFSACNQSRILATLRDALLPKLLSGEIRVGEAEEIVDDATAGSATPDITTPKPTPTRLSVSDDNDSRPTRPNIEDFDTNDIMAAFRQALRGHGTMLRDALLKDVSNRLGFQRLGTHVREILKRHLRAAIRRGIVASNGADEVLAATTKMADYDRDDMVGFIMSVTRKGSAYTREELTQAVASHVGFRRVTDGVRESIKSAINAAIRRGILGYEGETVWREG